MLNFAEVIDSGSQAGRVDSTLATESGKYLNQGEQACGAMNGGKSPGLAAKIASSRSAFGFVAAAADGFAILLATTGAAVAYNYTVYGWSALSESTLRLCLFVAFTFVVANVARRNYSVSNYLELAGHAQQTAAFWNVAFLLAAFLDFLDRADTSRGAFISFYFMGLAALYASRALVVRAVRNRARGGRLQAARIMVVGLAPEIDKLMRSDVLKTSGKEIVETCILAGDRSALEHDLARATRSARRQSLDEILIVAPLARADVIELCVNAFLEAPATINVHLESGSGLARFAGARVGVKGAQACLRLPGHSMSSADLALKRACDIVFALIALALFLPIMLAAALAIKLDSAGPVFFTQTRHGFNKRPFAILKFRTMTAMENGRQIQQATQRDFRVTRTGRFMRRFNIDELPQLVNVLRGEMSLVGPRPHAIAHDHQFAQDIAIYSRRHNIKPGITGWAQVNGFRGPTDTAEKIVRRVKYDLHYIDNWSLMLDLWILVLTLFSRKAYSNAF